MRDLAQRQGKELSFNNLLDLDAAMWAVACWPNRPACCIIKHTTPCGIAVAATAAEAFRKARSTDPVSAFGSVIAFNTVVDRATAQAMSDLFVEVVVAPSFHDEAMAVFAAKKQLRVVELPVSRGRRDARLQAGARRLPGAGPVRVRPLGPGVERRHRPAAHRAGVERSPVRLGRGRRGEVERHPAGPRRDGDRHRRRPDQPGGQRLPRRPQGPGAGPRSRRHRARLRRASFPSPTGSSRPPPPA